MLFTPSHGPGVQDKIFLQVVNSASLTAGAIARGNICIWDTVATLGTRGVYIILLPASEENSIRVAGIAEDAFPVLTATGADTNFTGLVQKFGFHDAVTFKSGTASVARLCPSDTAGSARPAVATTAIDVLTQFGLCLTPSGTVTSVAAILGP